MICIQGTSEMKSKPLSSFDQTLIDAGSFLEDFRDEQKLECLRTFVECVDIIGWIRTYTKGIIEQAVIIYPVQFCTASTVCIIMHVHDVVNGYCLQYIHASQTLCITQR